MKRSLIYIMFVIIATIYSPVLAYPTTLNEIKPAPNFLIILVHGKGQNSKVFYNNDSMEIVGQTLAEKGAFGNLKGYLENDLGLSGYVYSYDFKDNEMSIEEQGMELGNKGTGGKLSWLERARNNFIASHPAGVPVPNKYILIGHSMGGLAIRHYIYGKWGGSNYYNNDVEKAITLATPHLGSDSADVLKLNANYWAGLESSGFMALAWPYIIKRWSGWKLTEQVDIVDPNTGNIQKGLKFNLNPFDYLNPCNNYIDAAAVYSGLASPLIIGATYIAFGDPDGPAAKDLRLNSDAINELESAKLSSNCEPVKFRIISGHGTPTPNARLSENYLFARPIFGVSPLIAFGTSDFWQLPTEQAQIESLLFSFSGAIFTNDGDLAVPYDSARGIGIDSLKDAKRFDHLFYDSDLKTFMQAYPIIFGGAEVAYWSMMAFGVPESAAKWILLTPSLSLSAQIDHDMKDGGIKESILAHYMILKEAYNTSEHNPTLMELSLFDTPMATVTHLDTDVSIDAYNTDQTIKHTGIIQSVAILNSAEASDNPPYAADRSVSLIFNEGTTSEVEKFTSSMLVKVPVTQISGVIHDFKPLMLESFQISENFAAWQEFAPNIRSQQTDSQGFKYIETTVNKFKLHLDEWGRYTLSGLNFAEGQNLIAFKLRNRAKYSSNQVCKVIQNTIPMQPSKFMPEQNYMTNNVYQKVGIEFNKSTYYEDAIGYINILSFMVDGQELSSEASISSVLLNPYHPVASVEYIPKEPLSDGEHSIVVNAKSDVGVSQAMLEISG